VIRAVLDANGIISAVIAPLGPPRRIFDAWRNGRFALVTSDAIVEEVARKLSHPKIRDRYSVGEEDRGAIVALLLGAGEWMAGTTTIRPTSRDPDDDKIIVAAVESGAGFIVTGDRDLLSLGAYRGVQIVTPARFVDELAAPL